MAYYLLYDATGYFKIDPERNYAADVKEDYTSHPLGQGAAYKFQTIINSDQLGVLSALPMKEYPGYYIDNYVEFDVSNRTALQNRRANSDRRDCSCGTFNPNED